MAPFTSWALSLTAVSAAVCTSSATATLPAKDTLAKDDVCATEGNCALHALQARSAKGQLQQQQQQEQEQQQDKEQEQEEMKEKKQKADDEAAEEDTYVWTHEQASKQLGATEYSEEQWSDMYHELGGMVNEQCPHYVAYFWPKLSFFSQEVIRRVEYLPEDMDEATQKDLQHFTRDMAYLACTWSLDPRKDNPVPGFANVTGEYMKMIRLQPDSSLDTPLLPNGLAQNTSKLMTTDACLFWTSSLFCDLGYMARDYQGDVHDEQPEDLCWSTIKMPPYGFTLFGMSLMDGMPKMTADQVGQEFSRPEYLKCQEKGLDEQEVRNICPISGHYPAGMFGLDWGVPPPVGSERRKQVNTCNKKLGNPDFTGLTSAQVHVANEGDDIDLLKPYVGPLLNATEGMERRQYFESLPREEAEKLMKQQQEQVVKALASAMGGKQNIDITQIVHMAFEQR
mmetsp:Transcript_1989/g.4309  ORF Transcript_1989/g.4309 Transcript_1989/m.4309 type:complete len:453 (+) Transcript_1989:146-1504(+)|eukprot:CAMPEP_0206450542 /NCGR_PEP_ID=MMETSP0324_2-20121206/18789_1 /ASSEMBLY_ACC=CAM_ASM_000836 /TAXON_ID=2866 /ORGANISM="Crypthecodinium cohnii, Strain Seligo" /LENGTH=452 /DNA_ID=CAMNT_0053920215 /DNA_START=1078 /DNA_END=2436 /DNA_ORIENTATION=+